METIDDSWYLASPDETTPDVFPQLDTLSPAHLYRIVLVPEVEPRPPEYVYLKPLAASKGTLRHKFDITLTSWNSLWEAGRFAPYAVSRKHIPKQLRWLLKVEDRNLRLVPRFPGDRYDAYAPLYHLLPARELKRAGLPLLKRGLWPFWCHLYGRPLPSDFDSRLARAFSRYIWPLLNNRSAHFAFTSTDPIRVLSHHLDFWLPYIDVVAQRRMRYFGRCQPDGNDATVEQHIRELNEADADSGARADRPLRGGTLWMGEDEASEVAQELVDTADEHGTLRSMIDAVKSHRIRDDFSSVWSFEREDFERKLHRKRSKVKVVFVEMPDTVPVYSEDTEVHESLLWGDFLALLDARERRVAVCLRRGTVGPVDIAKELGYANHSPVSKALNRIRRKASAFFENN